VKVIKKINNNVVLCLDGNGKELVALGKGIGFGEIPYDVELRRIERTFYNVNDQYIKLLAELPDAVFEASILIVERAKAVLERGISSNVVFSLADHISFAAERMEKGMDVQMPFAYDVEHLYPKEMQVAQYGIRVIQKYLKVRLPKSEAIGIALHFINSAEQEVDTKRNRNTEKVIENMTDIIEENLGFSVNKAGFNYYRFCCHCRYFVKRIGERKQYTEQDEDLYQFFESNYPGIYACAIEVKQYLLDVFNVECSKEETLYLMMHIKRLYSNEDCNQ
jgi:beta-glucoside operon transcriptional antiterminator